MEATARSDIATLAALLAHDARQTMPPAPTVFLGRAAMLEAWTPLTDDWGEWQALPTRANRQPGAANYLRAPGEALFRPFNLELLRIEGGLILEVTSFPPSVFPGFGLPASLP